MKRMTTASILLLTGCLSAPAVGQRAGGVNAAPFDRTGSVDPDIPSPASIIGHEVGERAVRYDDMVRYLEALADASPYVTLTQYGGTHEGRALYFLTIAGAANHARLGANRGRTARGAEPGERETRGETRAASGGGFLYWNEWKFVQLIRFFE